MADLGFKEPSELKSAVEEWAVAVPELQDKACHLESIEVRVSLSLLQRPEYSSRCSHG